MCGLVGLAGNLNQMHNKAFQKLLLLDTVRGIDSTGIAVLGLGPKAKLKIHKALGLPDSLLYQKGVEDVLNYDMKPKGIYKLLMGHNRAATSGGVSEDTAHPFTFGKITGMHNGTVHAHNLIGDEKQDTQKIFRSIDEKGIDWTWERLNGAAALVWWNDEDETLNFIRNSQRPLCFAWNPAHNVLAWASEGWMLQVASKSSVANLNLEKKKDENDKPTDNNAVFSFPTDTLFSYKVTSTTCRLAEEPRKIEKKPQVNSTQKNTGTSSVGFQAGRNKFRNNTSRFRVNSRKKSKEKRSTKFNLFWSNGFEKAPTSTRDLVFTMDDIHLGSKERYAVCSVKDAQDLSIEVMFKNEEEQLRFENLFLEERCTLYTDARMRMKEEKFGKTTMTVLRVESVHVHPSSVIMAPEAEYNWDGEKVSKKEWEKRAKALPTGPCCGTCGDPLDISSHENMKWHAPEFIICEPCSENSYITNLLDQYRS
jgi:hypothetical protein